MPERSALPERSATGAGAMPATGSGPGSGPAAPGAGGPPTVHASCVLVGEAGILIEGASGAGKSTLAREIVAAARLAGRFARLVSDDRTRLEVRNGRIVARTVAAIAGQIEIRGLGIVGTAHEGGAVVRLVLSLSSDAPPRWPLPEDSLAPLCGIMVPRLFLQSGAASAPLVLAWLDAQASRLVTL